MDSSWWICYIGFSPGSNCGICPGYMYLLSNLNIRWTNSILYSVTLSCSYPSKYTDLWWDFCSNPRLRNHARTVSNEICTLQLISTQLWIQSRSMSYLAGLACTHSCVQIPMHEDEILHHVKNAFWISAGSTILRWKRKINCLRQWEDLVKRQLDRKRITAVSLTSGNSTICFAFSSLIKANQLKNLLIYLFISPSLLFRLTLKKCSISFWKIRTTQIWRHGFKLALAKQTETARKILRRLEVTCTNNFLD